ncbi:hypothetical protein [Bradyrhizobium sp. NP1]|uniref:hypothetical protein n=1 Tax=Bradyrhizobium sp. NP1 TaxID=3049772 RepID=UPI0025A54534|nr:hypothetical protein [Bradyrhizobium sp. NP1]WJR76498.1 hypothetical protein QOU61_27595 [Bradyrhizobium sp. NP1]
MVIDFLTAILKIILDMFWGGLAFQVGECVLRLVSFGSVRAASIDVPHSEFNWFCYRRDGNGRIEVESTLAGGIGLIFFFICLAIVLHFVR